MAEIALIGHNRCESTKSADYLFDISLVRIFAIILLVVSHSLCVHTGAWDAPDWLILSRPLKWIAKSISGFGIQIMPLIAGYIFAFQFVETKKIISFKDFVLKKTVRLLLPCYILSLLYYIGFVDDKDTVIISVIRQITNGIGHLWFLPSLFWGYIVLFAFNSLKINHFAGLVVVSMFYLFGAPVRWFGISSVNYVLFLMYCGFIIRLYVKNISESILLATALLILSVVLLYGRDHFINNNYVYSKQINSFIIIAISLFRFFGLYSIARNLIRMIPSKFNSTIKKYTSFCYGVYLFHQFVLIYLYYHTSICSILDSATIAFILTSFSLIASMITINLICRTNVGKALIG